MGVNWYVIVVSLMADDIDQHFLCLLAIILLLSSDVFRWVLFASCSGVLWYIVTEDADRPGS